MHGPAEATDDRLVTIKMAESIEGWLTPFEGELLYNLARNPSTDGVIVEIGSWKGKSTVFLARGSKAGRRDPVYSVDHHRGSAEHASSLGEMDTEAEFRKNVERASVSEIVLPLIMSSQEAAQKWRRRPVPIRLLWIDASHDYHSVSQDIALWNPFLISGGVIAFHDFTHSPAVRRAVRERVFCSGSFAQISLGGSILWARKRSTPSMLQAIRNVIMYVRLVTIEVPAWRVVRSSRLLTETVRRPGLFLSHLRR